MFPIDEVHTKRLQRKTRLEFDKGSTEGTKAGVTDREYEDQDYQDDKVLELSTIMKEDYVTEWITRGTLPIATTLQITSSQIGINGMYGERVYLNIVNYIGRTIDEKYQHRIKISLRSSLRIPDVPDQRRWRPTWQSEDYALGDTKILYEQVRIQAIEEPTWSESDHTHRRQSSATHTFWNEVQ
eukprot:1674319-Amphidinium_carterae.1